jgi:2',3'-cyclic-nucleotide 2'-phosphodiesterase/3'-nucleotidase
MFFAIIGKVIKMKPTRFLVSSDTHGVIYDHRYADYALDDMGLAKISTLIKHDKATHDVVYIDNGDALQGTPLLTYINKHNQKPHKLGEVFAVCGADYYNLGNHDFNYGLDVLFNFMDSMSAPCLTSNVLYHNKPLGKSAILQQNGVRYGLIGVVTDYIPHWEKPDNIKGVIFLDVVETVRIEKDKLIDHVDKIIVIYHGGIEKDLLTHKPTERYTKENVGYQLAYMEGVDILFSGHQHRSINTHTTQALALQCSNNATELMQVDVNPKDNSLTGSLVHLEGMAMDQDVIHVISSVEKQTQQWLDQPIGSLEEDLLIYDQDDARIHKHKLVSFINQVQLDATKADLSATSLFNNARGLAKIITMRDLVSTYVYPNTLVVKKMSGKQILEMLEQCATYFTINKDNKIDINPMYETPKPQHFNYDMIDGLNYTIKVSNPTGEKITDCTYKGTPIKEDDSFTVAMNNYRAVGGGDFVMVGEAKTIHDLGEDMVDLLAAYIDKHSPVSIDHTDNIHVVV